MNRANVKNCANCNWFRESCKETMIMDGHIVNSFCAYNEMFVTKECFCNHWEEFGEDYYFYVNHFDEILQELYKRYYEEKK